MVRVSRINSLNVLMNGFLVGQWHNFPNGATAFQYADEWLATSWGTSDLIVVATATASF
ncbi:MAG: hypothetical protein HC935_00975 [Pseudanabaena sp. SU_2_4]|nr:hypothetical protein [Pseudanabaena sp. SU_2_4]